MRDVKRRRTSSKNVRTSSKNVRMSRICLLVGLLFCGFVILNLCDFYENLFLMR